MAFFRALKEAAAEFVHCGCGTLAASVAFFALLSVLPMVFLFLNVLGFFVSYDRIGHEYLVTFLEGFLPNMWPQLADEIERVASERAVRWIVILTFAWFATLVFYEIEYAVHVVFGTKTRRNPFIATLRSVGLLGLFGVLVVASFLATQVMNLLVSIAPYIGGLGALVSSASQLLLSYLLPFLLLLTSVACLYRYLPQERPAWREAFTGALFLAVLWEVVKHLFSNYVQNLSVYGRMYGSLLAMVLFLLWMYYSAALFLFGAALVHRLQRMHEAHARQTVLAGSQPILPQEAPPTETLPISHPESAPTFEHPRAS
jgi:membrane protein